MACPYRYPKASTWSRGKLTPKIKRSRRSQANVWTCCRPLRFGMYISSVSSILAVVSSLLSAGYASPKVLTALTKLEWLLWLMRVSSLFFSFDHSLWTGSACRPPNADFYDQVRAVSGQTYNSPQQPDCPVSVLDVASVDWYGQHCHRSVTYSSATAPFIASR